MWPGHTKYKRVPKGQHGLTTGQVAERGFPGKETVWLSLISSALQKHFTY